SPSRTAKSPTCASSSTAFRSTPPAAPLRLRQQARRDLAPARPAAGLHHPPEIEQRMIEQRRLLEIDGMPTLRQHEESGRGNRAFEKDRDVDTRLVFVADGDQRGHFQLS